MMRESSTQIPKPQANTGKIPGQTQCYQRPPELGTSRRQGLDDPRDVVADEAEACDLGVGLHGAPQRILGIL